ncbi:MBL fold metallo-hydrolase [Bacterioplanoides sp.]|uniref:MBL fold metallo-hydrolase n=1 Tax=Bacterioplanoides sp. TaxID=2066072 RepID=UPI003B0068DF
MTDRKKHHHAPKGGFRNNEPMQMYHRSLWNVLKWKLFETLPKPSSVPVVEDDYSVFNRSEDSLVSWIGHATFLIRHNGLNIITDPHFSERASPVQWAGPKRYSPPAIDIDALPHVDVVVISHDHYDHLDRLSVLAIQKKQSDNPPLFMLPLGLGKWFDKKGIRNWVELDWWESHTHQGWTYTAVPCQHFSGRSIRQDHTLWCGWVFEADSEPDTPNEPGKRFYFAGDTGYSGDFKAIGERFSYMDMAMVPIGAYEPRWFMKEIHVNPEEAVHIHKDVGSRLSLAMHWGSFMLTNEPMLQPPEDLQQAKQQQGVADEEFIVIKPGKITPLF